MEKYSISWNMPGYMPDSEPMECETLEEAKESLAESITHYLEDMNLDPTVRYSALHEGTQALKAFDAAPAQVCNVYIGNYVYWITEI